MKGIGTGNGIVRKQIREREGKSEERRRERACDKSGEGKERERIKMEE